MATAKQLIDPHALISELRQSAKWHPDRFSGLMSAIIHVKEQPKVYAVEVPCKIGDYVWAIRSYKGHKHPQRGIVSDMYFANDMTLNIVVKHIARGEWGKTVFATDKEAYAAIEERKDNG